MKTSDKNILNVLYNNHRIVIDMITEYDYNGDVASYKLFNVSPYTGLMDMDIMARAWIDCGCPNDNGRKWTKDSIHAWIAG